MKKINKKLKPVLDVAGNGLWSNRNTKVPVSKMEVQYWINEPGEECPSPSGGELRVFFHKKSWNPEKHGLIYTDSLFLKQLKSHFKKIKIEGYVDYSEQGMQGNNYVSLDVDRKFINNWMKKKFKIVEKIW